MTSEQQSAITRFKDIVDYIKTLNLDNITDTEQLMLWRNGVRVTNS